MFKIAFMCFTFAGKSSVDSRHRMRQSCVFMRHRLALALIGSLSLHTFMLGLLPSMGGGKRADSPPPPSHRLQVRVLQPVTVAVTGLSQPIPEVKAKPLTKPVLNPPSPLLTDARSKPARAVMSILRQSEPAGTQSNAGAAPPPGTGKPDGNGEPPVPIPVLNLTIPTAKLPPRTALQATIEQEAIRPDAMTRSFERVLAQTAPVTTEITQTVDASGNATVKVRTPGGTYCLKNATPAGSTLYDLKTLAGNCSR